MRVLVINADLTAFQWLAALLQGGGAVVEHATAGEEGLDLLRHYDFDLALVELTLPDSDGVEVVRRMRAARIETPAVVMSAQARADTKVRAFSAGADDFICKPFDPAELQARLRAILRRSKGYSQPTLVLGSLQLNLDSREVTVADCSVHLTGKEFAILELLVLRKGMALTKEMFLNHLYGGMDEPVAKIIDVFICKIRKKLAEAGAPDLISTVWGRGFMVRDIALQGYNARPTLAALLHAPVVEPGEAIGPSLQGIFGAGEMQLMEVRNNSDRMVNLN